jgi:hypothetical protein
MTTRNRSVLKASGRTAPFPATAPALLCVSTCTRLYQFMFVLWPQRCRRSSMTPRSVRLRKLNSVRNGYLMGNQNLPRASKGTFNRRSRLHLHSLTRTLFRRSVDVRQEVVRKNKLPNFYHIPLTLFPKG